MVGNHGVNLYHEPRKPGGEVDAYKIFNMANS